jgi:hypothetical protein
VKSSQYRGSYLGSLYCLSWMLPMVMLSSMSNDPRPLETVGSGWSMTTNMAKMGLIILEHGDVV